MADAPKKREKHLLLPLLATLGESLQTYQRLP